MTGLDAEEERADGVLKHPRLCASLPVCHHAERQGTTYGSLEYVWGCASTVCFFPHCCRLIFLLAALGFLPECDRAALSIVQHPRTNRAESPSWLGMVSLALARFLLVGKCQQMSALTGLLFAKYQLKRRKQSVKMPKKPTRVHGRQKINGLPFSARKVPLHRSNPPSAIVTRCMMGLIFTKKARRHLLLQLCIAFCRKSLFGIFDDVQPRNASSAWSDTTRPACANMRFGINTFIGKKTLYPKNLRSTI